MVDRANRYPFDLKKIFLLLNINRQQNGQLNIKKREEKKDIIKCNGSNVLSSVRDNTDIHLEYGVDNINYSSDYSTGSLPNYTEDWDSVSKRS